MDASFLRPLFDKYHPHVPELEKLKALRAECQKRTKAISHRERNCKLREERQGQFEEKTKQDARVAFEADRKGHEKALTSLSLREARLIAEQNTLAEGFETIRIRLEAARKKEERIKVAAQQLQTAEAANGELFKIKRSLTTLLQGLAEVPEIPAQLLVSLANLAQ